MVYSVLEEQAKWLLRKLFLMTNVTCCGLLESRRESIGAIHAAKWITDKSEGLYSMESLINKKIKSHVNKEEV